MRTLLNYLIALGLVGLGVLAQEKKAPEKLTFMTKNGAVTFDHSAHVKRANGDCSTCHDKFIQAGREGAVELQSQPSQDCRNGQNFVRGVSSRRRLCLRIEGQLRQVPHEAVAAPNRAK
jgi:hypothetical protein